MNFRLIGAHGTFSRLCNELFREFLDVFVIICMDDLLVYSCTLHDHMDHVWEALTILRQHKLYAIPEKCGFLVSKIQT